MYHPCTNPHGINYFCNFAFKIGDGFSQPGFLVPSLFAGLAFSFALLTIIFGGVDLFTSNTMYLTMGVLKKKSRVKDLIKVWIATYIGNLIGVLFFTFLFVSTGLFDNIQPDHYLLTSAESKMNITITEMFFRGILCNWLVCLAVWIPMQTNNGAAKVMLIMIIVTAFFVSGYEHSVANMALFSVALSVPQPETITLIAGLTNLFFVTLGNIIGGSLFVGAAHVYINRELKEKKVNISETAKSMILHNEMCQILKKADSSFNV